MDWANLLSFILISAVIVGLIEAMRRAELKADAHAAQVQLLLAKAEEADRRKDVFLATLAHESAQSPGPLEQRLAALVAASARRGQSGRFAGDHVPPGPPMARLIDDLMDVSRHQAWPHPIASRPSPSLRPLIEGAVEAARPLIDHFDHQLQVDLADEPIWVDADPARLTQVFTNILINAAKHSGTGQQHLASARQRPRARPSSALRDNGAGIPTDMLTKIFEPFTQVEDRQERFYAGLGIGLALVKQLVELHGGTVEAHSEGPGTGSEFVVTLPTVARPTDRSLMPIGRAGRQRRPLLPRHEIVVADDIVDSATTLAKFGGHGARRGRGPRRSVDDRSDQHHVTRDLAIIDIGMPGMDGYEVARRLRADPATRTMVLVALTGYGQEARPRAGHRGRLRPSFDQAGQASRPCSGCSRPFRRARQLGLAQSVCSRPSVESLFAQLLLLLAPAVFGFGQLPGQLGQLRDAAAGLRPDRSPPAAGC